ncbi:hypothetical protein BKA62DRAFT_612214 [Auriculariales sp. MPI-PUGE-AT-0066]|nr:hypothetical protein BKA62DRAFT_612214 [Auriculariales sp. MPI-PUGE-AT-0066]
MFIAYFVSGHGYGHATRVSALVGHLLALGARLIEHPSLSPPAHIFSDSINAGAQYRNADIDPIIVQPLAYRIDRTKSVKILESFLKRKHQKVKTESDWLTANAIDCVITDAACLGCLAADAAGIPSILCTNFTFDSIFSFLGTHFVDQSSELEPVTPDAMGEDTPIPARQLASLVDQLFEGYTKADVLLLLPGAIPIPSFMDFAPLPSPAWVTSDNTHFTNVIAEKLRSLQTHQSLEAASNDRQVIPTPLLVREATRDIYSSLDARKKILLYAGVPDELHGHKVLVVSFGGQRIVAPRSVTGSAQVSRSASHTPGSSERPRTPRTPSPPASDDIRRPQARRTSPAPQDLMQAVEHLHEQLNIAISDRPALSQQRERSHLAPQGPAASGRVATPSHIYVPGAPSGAAHMSSRVEHGAAEPPPVVELQDGITIEPPIEGASPTAEEVVVEPRLLPDDSWIAIVCGAGDAWGHEHLPTHFFVAPKDVYMPDLTAISDCYLGKLGYSTCAECVDSCTPFVFVPRPLFVEEVGLRILLETRGVGVQMSREQYESGNWADDIEAAYTQGKAQKEEKRRKGMVDETRWQNTRQLASDVIEWIEHRRTGSQQSGI